MIVLIAAFVAAGLFQLFAPRRLLLLGTRWMIQGGRDAGPSDDFVVWSRFGGLFVVGLAAALTWMLVSLNVEHARTERLGVAWDEPTPSLDRGNADTLDPVVGVDVAAPGDLVVRVAPDHRCELDRLVVLEDDRTVALAIVMSPGPLWAETTGTSFLGTPSQEREQSATCEDDLDEGLLGWITLVHVPLGQPLGDRRVVDASTGSSVPPVSVTGP